MTGHHYPLVFVDGKLMITGSAEFYHVLRAVAARRVT